MRFSRLESSFRVRFEPYAELHLDYLPPGRISDNVVGLFYKRLGSIPRADNPQGSTVRGTATTCDFPGVNPSRCPPRGQATTPAFRGADRLPSAHAASGCRKVPRRGHSGKPRFPSRTVRGADSGIGIRVSAGRTVGSSEHDVDDGKVSAVEGASIRKLQQIPPRGQWSRYSGVRGADR